MCVRLRALPVEAALDNAKKPTPKPQEHLALKPLVVGYGGRRDML